MKRILIIFMVLAAVIASSFNPVHAGGDKVIVYLLNGTNVEGELIELSPACVKIDPDGSVSYRAIAADEIERVVIVETGREYLYPLTEEELSPEIRKELDKTRNKRPRETLSPVSFSLSGRMYVPTGDYYEGLGAGFGVAPKIQFRFGQGDPDDMAILLGISYGYGSLGIEDETWCFYDPDIGDICVEFTKCTVHQWTFDLGFTSKPNSDHSFMYMNVGFSILSHKITGYAYTDFERAPEETTDDTKVGLNFSIGGVVGISENTGISIDGGMDFMFQENNNSYDYDYYDSPEVAGAMFTFSVGLVFGL